MHRVTACNEVRRGLDVTFGDGIYNIHLVGAQCTGREENVFDCPGAQYDIMHDCFFDGAGVRCSTEGKFEPLESDTAILSIGVNPG